MGFAPLLSTTFRYLMRRAAGRAGTATRQLGEGLAWLPPPAVVVLARDRLAVACYSTHPVVRVPAVLAGFVAAP